MTSSCRNNQLQVPSSSIETGPVCIHLHAKKTKAERMKENQRNSEDLHEIAEEKGGYVKPRVTKVDVYETGALGGSCAGGTLADAEECEFTS